ncbi:uncharacterized protein LOC124945081 [Impatiens glandulifera]|uniref:uncharacterized protein LOC124945081 n=1 Tax=Impatiens glandulifera TaxID=253017 RepID=UPI001FB0ED1A|nr:uncharacterized protein LOC124945081 [Impatiens glandulifera]
MMDCAGNLQPGVRKGGKKKQVKDEMDRIKQAEKKKRRLEKALATSAAICYELEMKKQKKREEQQRLDEEGAAIAEAVALHVLLGEEDSNEEMNRWNILNLQGHYLEPPACYEPDFRGSRWNEWGKNCWSLSPPYANDPEISLAVASLHLSEDAHADVCVFNRILHG